MSVENSSTSPMRRDDDPLVSAGLEIAMKWGAALGGPDQLKVALEALEPQLKREHQIRLRQLDAQRQAAERKARSEREVRQHRFRMASLIVGGLMSIAMLGAGVYVARDVWWLAMVLCGPSLIAILKIVVLRRSEASDMTAVAAAARGATNAAAQAQPPI
ncbi:hypothetical protein QF037_006286 [Streptomyces canus]|uniref:hypothetical protein n=1 Tax=Streptomyces canus TaxID=58343 RepID=UPI00278AE362|nr:hypothetical protein [Streptomyces canus]MDQ0601941.1 hypothetical protein [Streptomyces canus]